MQTRRIKFTFTEKIKSWKSKENEKNINSKFKSKSAKRRIKVSTLNFEQWNQEFKVQSLKLKVERKKQDNAGVVFSQLKSWNSSVQKQQMKSYLLSWFLHISLLQVHPGQGETEKVCFPFPEYQQSSTEVKISLEWIKRN